MSAKQKVRRENSCLVPWPSGYLLGRSLPYFRLREPLVITQNGEAKLVVTDVNSSEEQEGTMSLLTLLGNG